MTTALTTQNGQQHTITPEVRECDPRQLIFIQSRAQMDFALVDEYIQMMEEGTRFDPCDAIEADDDTIYVWDGFHRGQAAIKLEKRLDVKIEPGTKDAAEWKALSANTKHGLRRTNEDKQRVVKNALKHPRGASLSNRAIARHCAVDEGMVRTWRRTLEACAEIPHVPIRDITRTTADGKKQQYQTSVSGAEAYFTIQELEDHLRDYLTGDTHDRETYLKGFLQQTVVGQACLREIEKGLAYKKQQQGKKYRKSDLNKAAKNLLDTLLQILCSGTQEHGQPCDFIGVESQMFQQHDKWYCAKCFQKIQPEKEPASHGDVSIGDPADLDNIILQVYDGLSNEYKAEMLKKAIFSAAILKNLSERIPGFPPEAIRERCSALFDRISPKKPGAAQIEGASESPASETDQHHPTAIAASIAELEKEIAENWLFIEKDPQKAIESLQAIRDKTKSGQFVLSNIYNQLKDDGKVLPGQKHGIRQACWNLLERLEAPQSGKEQPEAAQQPKSDFGNCAMCGNALTGPGTPAYDLAGQICDACYGVKWKQQREKEEHYIENFQFIIMKISDQGLYELRAYILGEIEDRKEAPVTPEPELPATAGTGAEMPPAALSEAEASPEVAMVQEEQEPEQEESAIKDLCSLCEYHRMRNSSKHGKSLGQSYFGKCIREGGLCKEVAALIEAQKATQPEPMSGEPIPESIDATESDEEITARIIQLAQEHKTTRGSAGARKLLPIVEEQGILNLKGESWSRSGLDRYLHELKAEGKLV